MDRKVNEYIIKDGKIHTNLVGLELLNTPILNKGTGFTRQERDDFFLEGLLPPHINKISEQAVRCKEIFFKKSTPLEKHIYLRQLQDSNETLFYHFVIQHIEETLPILYTPTVGDACELFSHIYRRPRGLFISYPSRRHIVKILDNFPLDHVEVIVVTDGERILGLGDMGAGGMGIPIGKLTLYSACGGINPKNTLPIFLDVGTNNTEKRNDPDYLGWRHERISGDEYFEFLDEFVTAVKRKFPKVLLQFEDFAQTHAYPLLNKYRDKLCTFNDDIQGTAAVTVGAILSAVKVTDSKITDHCIAVLGGGSAGCGISEQIVQAMIVAGLSEKEARSRFYIVDQEGLLLNNNKQLKSFQQGLVQDISVIANWQVKDKTYISLEDVINNAKPTILLGVSGQPSLFTQQIIETMAQYTQRPIIFPMSNPTSRAEAKPEDIITWTKGQAIIATGSPFEPVEFEGKQYPIAQSNNCYIFPGMGLGVLAVQAKHVSDSMFMQASIALAEASPVTNKTGDDLLPLLRDIREVSKKIAFAVAKQAQKEGLARTMADEELQAAIEETMWQPHYLDYVLIKN